MSSRARLKWALAVGWFASTALGCADFERGARSPDAGSSALDASSENEGDGGSTVVTEAGAGVSFAATIHPLLLASCQSCHSASGTASSTSFLLTGEVEEDFALAASLVNAANPAESRLLRKAAGQAHGGGAIFPPASTEYQSLLAWAAGGAAP